ncbi:MAG: hypothetical protein WA705_31645 [Candidatus Ozemobacteraceae bacterium]
MVREVRQKRVLFAEPLLSSTYGEAEKGIEKLITIIDKGLEAVKDDQDKLRSQVADIREVSDCLKPENGSLVERSIKFEALRKRFEGSEDNVSDCCLGGGKELRDDG